MVMTHIRIERAIYCVAISMPRRNEDNIGAGHDNKAYLILWYASDDHRKYFAAVEVTILKAM